LALDIQQLERRLEDIAIAIQRLKNAMLKNKRICLIVNNDYDVAVEVGDWVLVYDDSLDNQYSTTRKFTKRWFGPCVVIQVGDYRNFKEPREIKKNKIDLICLGYSL